MSYLSDIEKFIEENFTPATPETANVKISTEDLLTFIFRTFPYDSIMEHQLTDILTSLGYERHTYVLERNEVTGKGKKQQTTVHKSLSVGWCMKTHLDLITETLKDE